MQPSDRRIKSFRAFCETEGWFAGGGRVAGRPLLLVLTPCHAPPAFSLRPDPAQRPSGGSRTEQRAHEPERWGRNSAANPTAMMPRHTCLDDRSSTPVPTGKLPGRRIEAEADAGISSGCEIAQTIDVAGGRFSEAADLSPCPTRHPRRRCLSVPFSPCALFGNDAE